MDTPRRWQVASLATAVAGLGLGSLMVGRSPSVEVAPIDLDAVTVSSTSDDPSFRLPLPDPPEIVVPRVREDQLSPEDAAASAEADSPDEPVTSTSRERSSEVQAPTPPDADDDDWEEDDDPADDDPADDDDDPADDDDDPAESVDSPDEDDD